MRIIVDKETAQQVAAELIAVGVAFDYQRATAVEERWTLVDGPASYDPTLHWIIVDDSRAELLNCVWSIVNERRQRARSTGEMIVRVAGKLPTVGKGG